MPWKRQKAHMLWERHVGFGKDIFYNCSPCGFGKSFGVQCQLVACCFGKSNPKWLAMPWKRQKAHICFGKGIWVLEKVDLGVDIAGLMQRHHEKCVKKGCFGMGILKKSQNVIY
jgi:hypothetical protein